MALKRRTIEFADRLLADPSISQTQAYLDTHETNNKDTARIQASRLLTKPSVQIYLKKHVQMAKQNIVMMASDESVKPDTRLKANQDILDRAVGKPTIRTESTNTNLNLNIEASQELNDQFTAFLKAKTQQG